MYNASDNNLNAFCFVFPNKWKIQKRFTVGGWGDAGPCLPFLSTNMGDNHSHFLESLTLFLGKNYPDLPLGVFFPIKEEQLIEVSTLCDFID